MWNVFPLARMMRERTYNIPYLIASSSVSNFVSSSASTSSIVCLVTCWWVAKYFWTNQGWIVAGFKNVDPTHFKPVIRENSLMENRPMSTPTSNHRASISVRFEGSAKRITMLWTTYPAQPSLSNIKKFFISGCCFNSLNWDLERPFRSFLIVSSKLTQWVIFPFIISSSENTRIN